MYKRKLIEKLKESIAAVMPISAIVLIISMIAVPVESGTLLVFIFGTIMLITGMMLFSLGAEMSMERMGERMGSKLTKSKSLPLLLITGFFLGFLITVSEPDLQVLAEQVKSIPKMALILSIAAGVGLFLVVSILRMLIGIPIRALLIASYFVIIVLSFFVPDEFKAIAYDSGGVTTGPMTVPFIMAFGIGICATRNDKHAGDDSFGLVALCSVGPILAIQILSLIYKTDSVEYSQSIIPDIHDSVMLGKAFIVQIPNYMKEIAISLLPIVGFFLVFQLVTLRLEKHTVKKILIGIIYTYVGLVLFLTGANVGFLPAGSYLGSKLAEMGNFRWFIIPIGMLMGFFIVRAEPAVYVLEKQVEELTDGEISGKSLSISLSCGVCISVGIAMLRVLTGIPILWFIIPGYSVALALSFFVPKMFTAIAFDSGGVASGPMTVAFLLPFAVGACQSVGGNVVTDAFGVVAMVAMTPLIAIQILGVIYTYKIRKNPKDEAPDETEYQNCIIEL